MKTAQSGTSDAQVLANQQARIWVRFGVRVVVIAIASALLMQRVSLIAANRSVLDALGGVIALWPLWTQLGQNYAARIDRGRLNADGGNNEAAQALLAPFASPLVSRLFDVSGEGTYFLAHVLFERGETEKSVALHQQNQRPTLWGKKSADFLSPLESTPPLP